MTLRTKRILSLSLTALGLVLLCLLGVWVGKPMLQFVSDPEAFRDWIDQSGIWGRLAFLGMMTFQVILAVIPGEPLEICAGYAFGGIEGTCLCLLSTTVGGAILFLLVRRFGVKFVELFVSLEKIHSMKFLQNERRVNSVIFWVFLIPGTPKDLMSYVVGLTPMKFSTWMWITSLARLPSIVTSTFGGAAIGDQNYLTAAIIFGATALAALCGWYGYQRFAARRQKKKNHKTR